MAYNKSRRRRSTRRKSRSRRRSVRRSVKKSRRRNSRRRRSSRRLSRRRTSKRRRSSRKRSRSTRRTSRRRTAKFGMNTNHIKSVKIYTEEGCGACVAAKELLDKRKSTIGFTLEKLKRKDHEKEVNKLTMNKLGNKGPYPFVPVVFVNGKFIGGYTELKKMME